MFKFFIDRPILAASLSALIFVLGVMSINGLPLANYPRVSPPTVSISAFYPGADANTVSQSVAAVLERQINGAEGMIYISSKCFNNGYLSMNVTFEVGRNDDMSLVDVQNRVAQAESSLPEEVIRQGITVKKQSPDILMVVGLYSPKGTVDELTLANYASLNLKDILGRVSGVGSVALIGAGDYGMRIWLDPQRLQYYNMTVADVRSAVNDQNILAPAGAFGSAPSPADVKFERPAQVKGRLNSPEEFKELVVRSNEDGSVVRLKDVAPDIDKELNGEIKNSPGVELGAFSYVNFSRINIDGANLPATLLLVYQLPSGNAVQISKQARAVLEDMKKNFPPDVDYIIGMDTAEFVTESLHELIVTLVEALVLVLLVVYFFLGSLRSSLVPMIAVPVSLIGVFAFFPLLGLNINNLTLFALVLAVGIVVDDAIVVVEAVEVHLEKGLTPREAAYRAMDDVGFTIVGITCALISVFLPMTVLGGLTGELYKQFALTLAISVAISAFNSLTLSPALCALVLKSKKEEEKPFILVRLFNSFYSFIFGRYSSLLNAIVRKSFIAVLILAVLYVGLGGIMKIMPTSLVPPEDQKAFFVSVQMPSSASQDRTIDYCNRLAAEIKKQPEIAMISIIGGQNVATGAQSSSVASLIVLLSPWGERQGPGQDAISVIGKTQKIISQPAFSEAQAMAFNVPTISGLGMGLDLAFELENITSDPSPQVLENARLAVQMPLWQNKTLLTPISAFRMDSQQVRLEVDREKAKSQGVAISSIFDTLGTFLGGSYINDFDQFGRTYRVMMQARDSYRDNPAVMNNFYMKNQSGHLVPVSTFIDATDINGPEFLTRYNLYPSLEFMAGASPGHSTGQAMGAIEQIVAEKLPQFKLEWTGQAYQEKLAAGQTTVVLILAFMCCFLVLAGLYESFSSPLVVILSSAIAIFGGMSGQLIRGLSMDLFMQVGLVVLIGLAAKNAILIVQFAQERQKEGYSPIEAAKLAGEQRFRPILMTSFAFILGVIPLVVASGAGANSRHSLGTGVFSGMIVATAVGVFVIPGLYVAMQKFKVFLSRKRV